jgi:hypothetical protein
MRYRLMASYRGVPYEAGVGPSDSDVVLFAACPPPEELGFEPATGHWRKHLVRSEVDAVWQSRPVGVYRGEPCIVLDDLGDRLHIAYVGRDANRASRLGYWQVDRGVFELLALREEVTDLTEERVESAPGGGETGGRQAEPVVPADLQQAGPGSLRDAATDADPLVDTRPTAPVFSANAPQSEPERLADGTLGTGSPAEEATPLAQPNGIEPGAAGTATAIPAAPEPMAGVQAAGLPVRDGAAATSAPPDGLDSIASQVPRLDTSPVDHEPTEGSGQTRRRAARRQRVSTRDIFSGLTDLAAIPRAAYALEAEVDGALCLLATGDGFEVFVAADGARHEVRSFSDEEAAYFYLFGVLAAEAVRNGSLAPVRTIGAPQEAG